MKALLTFQSYNAVHKIKTMDELKQCFPVNGPDDLSWLLCSTSGVHGHYGTIDDLEKDINHNGSGTITILIIRPKPSVCLTAI